MKNNKLLFVLMIGLSSAIAVSCSQQAVTPAQKRQNIIDYAMRPENYTDLKQDLAFLESQGLLQPHSFLNLLQENVTESQDATFNEVIEKAEDLITAQMKYPFISTVQHALAQMNPLYKYIDFVYDPIFTYIMKRKDNDMNLQNIVRGWLLEWSETTDKHKWIPLHIAVNRGHTEIACMLIDAGANVNIQITNSQITNSGIFLLHIATARGLIEIVQRLIIAGADVNTQSSGSLTPLHIAAKNSHTEIVQILVQHGADINIRNHHGRVAEDLAITDEIRDILRRARQGNNQYEAGWCQIS